MPSAQEVQQRRGACSWDVSLSFTKVREQLVERDGKLSDAHASGVVYGVGHRGAGAANAQFAKSFDAEHVCLLVEAIDHDRIELRDVGVHRHEVLREVAVDESAAAQVDHCFLVQRHAQPPDHSANELRTRGLGIQYAAYREDSEHSSHSDLSRINVDTDLGEVGAVSVYGVRAVVRV